MSYPPNIEYKFCPVFSTVLFQFCPVFSVEPHPFCPVLLHFVEDIEKLRKECENETRLRKSNPPEKTKPACENRRVFLN